MIINAWRIFKKRHQAFAFTGEGARRFGGRWNSKGVAMVYASESPSLAALEMLVHLQTHEILHAYRLASMSFDNELLEELAIDALPKRWRRDPAPRQLQAIGDEWIHRASSVVLRVPSAIIDGQWNYLFNPDHPAFAKCIRGKAAPFQFDKRLAK